MRGPGRAPPPRVTEGFLRARLSWSSYPPRVKRTLLFTLREYGRPATVRTVLSESTPSPAQKPISARKHRAGTIVTFMRCVRKGSRRLHRQETVPGAACRHDHASTGVIRSCRRIVRFTALLSGRSRSFRPHQVRTAGTGRASRTARPHPQPGPRPAHESDKPNTHRPTLSPTHEPDQPNTHPTHPQPDPRPAHEHDKPNPPSAHHPDFTVIILTGNLGDFGTGSGAVAAKIRPHP
ncbi:MAG: hypothetical protein V7603_2791 [Micromonosporaceae bacterium]